MILEHNTYKEAISDVKISDEAGMEMIENAMERSRRRSQKWRAQFVAAVAGIAVVFLSVNGICFAATGMNAWDLFQSLYLESGEDAKAIAESFKESGEVLTYGNTQYTLENYWYDKENGLLYFTIRTDSLDGKPLNIADDSYEVYPTPNDFFSPGGGMTVGHGDSIVSKNGTSMTRYYHASIADRDEVQEYSILRKEEYSADAMLCYLSVKEGEIEEDGTIPYKEIGYFAMEPTGETKSLELDGSALESCTRITLNGAAMNLFFEDAFGEEHGKPEPFDLIELRMKDGTSTYLVNGLPEGDWEIIAAEDGINIIGYKSAEMDMTGDRYLGGFSYGAGGDPYAESGWDSEYMSCYIRFIDVDNIEAVYADGVELPIIDNK